MLKRYLILGSLAVMQFFARAQQKPDSMVIAIPKTTIDLVYNLYLQNGNNSAVTGGLGTEKLVVYGPSVSVKKAGLKKTLSFTAGADIITSASTDKIDFIESSASRRDVRYFTNCKYEINNYNEKNLSLYGGVGLSIESDYFSRQIKAGFVKSKPATGAVFNSEFQFLYDDLRWGRINAKYLKKVRLIYPAELRFKEWYPGVKRYTYSLKSGYSKPVNPKMVAGVYTDLSYQHGLLETPFHRVYFSDFIVSTEQLPKDRWRASLALKSNNFLAGGIILKNVLNFYTDNFGIRSIGIENESGLRLNRKWTIIPGGGIYRQTASIYFKGYRQHSSTEKYFTSDYDLSSFTTYSGNLAIKFYPEKSISRHSNIMACILRYGYFNRTNGLESHVISLSFSLEKN